jgi:adenosylcobinamide-GDP ribazoletransferase
MIRMYINGFLLNLRFLTRIPVPIAGEHDDRAFAAGTIFAPIIGLLIGLLMAGVYLVLAPMGKRDLAIFMAMAAEIAITGGLHLDGLADSFDGLFSYRDKARVLAIMKDSRLGTSGAIALFLVLMLKYLLLVSMTDTQLVPCLVAMPVLSRMTIAWSAGLSPYAGTEKEGRAAGLIRHAGAVEIIIATTLAFITSIVFLRMAVVLLTMIIVAFTLLVNLYVKFRIGGITGDVIGAVIELSEALFLFSVLVLDKLYAWQHMTFI